MHACSSEMACVSIIDAFYEELAERAADEGLCLPWYKTCLVIRALGEQKRFRSEMTLPGLRLQSVDGEKYFIPEAKFTGIAENRKEAENAAACEACGFLTTFMRRSELIASEWMIDNDNPLYKSIVERQPAVSSSSDSEPEMPREGHRLLLIAPVVRLSYKNRKELRKKTRSHNGPPSSPPSSKPKSGSSSNTNGENIALLSNELHLLRIQIDRLNSLVEQHPPPPPASVTQPASTSFVPDIEPT